MDKVFAVAGISKMDDVYKVRFAKDLSRVKVLEKNGHTYVRLIELPKAMDKAAAVAFLKGHVDFQDTIAQHTLAGEGKVAPAAKAPKVKEVTLPAAKAKADKTPAEIAAIKAKNLETLRKVGKTWEQTRETVGEEMLADAASIMDAIDGDLPKFLKKDYLNTLND